MGENKIIYCPLCGRRVASHDGRSTTNAIGDCKKCNKRVVYKVMTGEILTKEIPARATASGKTFY